MFGNLYIAFVVVFGLKLQGWDEDVQGACYHTNGLSTNNAAHPFVDEIYLGLTSIYFMVALSIPLRDTILRLSEQLQSDAWSSHPSRASEFIRGTFSAVLSVMSPSWPLASLNKSLLMIRGALPSDFQQEHPLRHWEVTRATISEHLSRPGLPAWLGTVFTILYPEDPDTRSSPPTVFSTILSQLSSNTYTSLFLALIQCPVHGYILFTIRASNDAYLAGESENHWGFGQIVALVLLTDVLMDCIRAVVGESTYKWSGIITADHKWHRIQV